MAIQKKLKEDLLKAEEEIKLAAAPELTVKQMREELQQEYHKQAQLFIDQQMAELQAKMQANFEAAVDQKVQEQMQARAMERSSDFEMSQDVGNGGAPKMMTRKQMKKFGTNVTNVIGHEQSDDDSKYGQIYGK